MLSTHPQFRRDVNIRTGLATLQDFRPSTNRALVSLRSMRQRTAARKKRIMAARRRLVVLDAGMLEQPSNTSRVVVQTVMRNKALHQLVFFNLLLRRLSGVLCRTKEHGPLPIYQGFDFCITRARPRGLPTWQ